MAVQAAFFFGQQVVQRRKPGSPLDHLACGQHPVFAEFGADDLHTHGQTIDQPGRHSDGPNRDGMQAGPCKVCESARSMGFILRG
jgi:hypothetical protein